MPPHSDQSATTRTPSASPHAPATQLVAALSVTGMVGTFAGIAAMLAIGAPLVALYPLLALLLVVGAGYVLASRSKLPLASLATIRSLGLLGVAVMYPASSGLPWLLVPLILLPYLDPRDDTDSVNPAAALAATVLLLLTIVVPLEIVAPLLPASVASQGVPGVVVWLMVDAFWIGRYVRRTNVRSETRQEAVTRLEAIVSGLPEKIVGLDATGRVSTKVRFDGLEIGRPIGEWFDLSCRENIALLFAGAGPITEPREVDAWRVDDTDRQRRWYTVRVVPFGGETPLLATFTDVTERKHVEAALRRAKEEAEAATRTKSAFLANMSHEIRTPMAAILGYTDLLLTPDADVKQTIEWVQTIRRNGEHLLSLLNDILDISKIEAGKLEVENIPCSVVQIVSEVDALMAPKAMSKGLKLKTEYQTDVPHSITTDPTRLRQILLNLLGNAVKFTKRGRVKLTIATRTRSDNSTAIFFQVSDTGIGIAEERLNALFMPFVQADTATTRKFGGSGLGLAISSRLADLMNGRIDAASDVGKGSTFTMSLELGDAASLQMVDPATVHVAKSAELDQLFVEDRILERARILVAEDGRDNQRLIAFHLRRTGADVSIANDGEEAQQKASSARADGRPFDLILMDMQMPKLDGYSATRRLRSHGHTEPIIALTAHAMVGDRERCTRAGCNDYLSKPFKGNDLVELAVRHVHSHRTGTHPGLVVPRLTKPAVDLARSSRTRPPGAATIGDDTLATVLEQLSQSFLGGVRDRITALRAASKAKDVADLKVLAHKLKGAGGSYGFPEISESADLIERVIASGDLNAPLSAAIDELERVYLAAQQARQPSTAEAG